MDRTCFDILADLFAADLDEELLRRAKAKTPTERIVWLEEMQAFADEARKGQATLKGDPLEAPRAARTSR